MTNSAHRLLATRGYVRTSAMPGCDHAAQLAALIAAGADEDLIETDDATHPGDTRPGLERLLAHANPGDTLLVWRLDRLAWSPAHLARTLTHLDQAGVRVKSIHDDLDTGAVHAGRCLPCEAGNGRVCRVGQFGSSLEQQPWRPWIGRSLVRRRIAIRYPVWAGPSGSRRHRWTTRQ